MSASEPVEQAASLDTGLPHVNELTTLQQNLGSGYNRDDSHELNSNCGPSVKMPPQSQNSNSAATGSSHISFTHSEPSNFRVKIEPSDAVPAKTNGEPLRFDVNSERTPADGVTEEPLEIQCGENAALLYVSKLCQGSKGPCILFQGEWLTPNELQYISGRETAKDWKRSIRYKGKSLKSLIARGLIKVHPPICDCLGCRISSPVNRGRLASKCSVSSPPSPTRKRKESSKALWRQDGFEMGLPFAGARPSSSSDVDNCMSASVVRNGIDARASPVDSNSSTASECSEPGDDCPFSPGTEPKRARSVSPVNSTKLVNMKRRATDRFQFDPRSTFFFRELPTEYNLSPSSGDASKQGRKDITSVELANHHRSQETGEISSGNHANRSAFRAVHQDTANSHNDVVAENHVNTDALQRDLASRAAKNAKQPQKQPTSYIPFTQLPSPSPLISPTHSSPRLIPDPLLLASPHGPSIYHQALRGSLSGVPSAALHQSLMHYRLLTPPSPHSPLAQNIPLQSSFIQANAAAAAAAARAGLQGLPVSHSSMTIHRSSRPTSPKNTSMMNGHADENRNLKKARMTHVEDEKQEEEDRNHSRETEVVSDNRISQASASDRDRKSPDISTGSNERQSPFATPKASPSGKDPPRVSPYKLVPRFKPDLNENVLEWSVDDVCHFVSSLTGSSDIAHAFREEHIDGHSFVLMQEDHLLNRMSIRLGPALKITAQIKKLTENLEIEESSPN